MIPHENRTGSHTGMAQTELLKTKCQKTNDLSESKKKQKKHL